MRNNQRLIDSISKLKIRDKALSKATDKFCELFVNISQSKLKKCDKRAIQFLLYRWFQFIAGRKFGLPELITNKNLSGKVPFKRATFFTVAGLLGFFVQFW